MKIGIIGTGSIAGFHLEGFRSAGAEIAAVINRNTGSAERFASEYGCGSGSVFSSLEQAAGAAGLEAVAVTVPNSLHMPYCIEAMNMGLHVFCEKPPALNAAEMEKIIEVQERTGMTLMFNFNNRARPESVAMKDFLDSGKAGRINSAQASWIRRAGIPGFGGWFTNRNLAGGGPVIDLVHMLDLALYFMDYPEPSWVTAAAYDTFMGDTAFKGPWGMEDVAGGVTDVETASHAMITFSGGQCLFSRASWAEMNRTESAAVSFQAVKAGGKVERFFPAEGDDAQSVDSCEVYCVDNGKHFDRNLEFERDPTMGRLASARNFIEVLDGRAAPLNSPQQALSLMKIIDAIYKSAETGVPVNMS